MRAKADSYRLCLQPDRPHRRAVATARPPGGYDRRLDRPSPGAV